MRKLSVACLIVLLMSSAALADWSITTTWTRSVGPNLASEEVRLDGAVKCTINATAPTTCQFNVTAISGQHVTIRSINAQGSYSDTTPIALLAVPAPATGVLVNVTYVSP
jgi:hypothetical protein